jgi:hypothetical protein
VGAIEFDVPDAPGRLTVAAVGEDKADALAKAALLAERITSDPVMASMMPPEAASALRTAKGLAAAAKRGLPTLQRAWGMLRGPGKRQLARVLAEDMAKREEVGIAPLAIFAAKYGPGAARKAAAMYKARKARKRKRAREPSEETPEAEPPQESESESESAPDEGGE